MAKNNGSSEGNGGASKSKFVRFRVLIYPKFQLTLVAANAAVLILVCGIIALQSWRSMERLQELGVKAGLNPDHPYFEFLSLQARTFYSNLASGCVAAFVLSSIVIVLLSHRMAGPLIRLRRYFEDLKATGELKPLSFRHGDYFSDLPEVINDGITAVKDKAEGSGDGSHTRRVA